MGKTFKKSFEMIILQEMGSRNINASEKKNRPKGSYAPTPGCYTCILQNIQTSSPLKRLGQFKPNFMSNIYRMGEPMCIFII